jgi:autotransporter passenger strand-loop-strand repeat protein
VAGSNSPDGSYLLPGSGGSLVTSAGTWTFGSPLDGGYPVLLNGTPLGSDLGEELCVANGGTMYRVAQGSWSEFISSSEYPPGYFVGGNGPYNNGHLAFSVVENSAAQRIEIPPTGDNNTSETLIYSIVSLPNPSFGELLMPDGVTPVSAGQTLANYTVLNTLEFLPAHNATGTASFEFATTESGGLLTDVTQQSITITATPPVVTSASLTVSANAGATPINISAPTDPNFTPSQLTITITDLPTDGTVTLSTGQAVSVGQVVSISQLQGLNFTPTAGVKGEASILWYSVTDPGGGYVLGQAALIVAPPVSAAPVPPYTPPSPTQPWHDPAVTTLTGSGVESAPTVLQPSQAGDIVGLDLQNTGGSTEPQGFVTFGQVFRDGDVSSAVVSGGLVARIDGANYAVQVGGESYYPDGSVEQAILTFDAPSISAGGTLQVMLASGSATVPMSQTAPTSQGLLTKLQSDDVTVNFSNIATFVSADGVYSTSTPASASVDAAAALQAAISAGTVSEFLYASGSTADEVNEFDFTTNVSGIPGLQVEFDIRAYADGTTTTDVIFDNGSVFTSGSDLKYNVTIAQGSQSFTTSGVQQYLYSMWDHEIDSPETISPNVQYDVPYLIATGALENYDTSFGVSAATIQAEQSQLNSTGTVLKSTGPLGTANVDVHMEDTGVRPDIAPQPNWTALWLLSQNATAQQIIMDNGDASGGVPWHYNDYSTQTGALAVPMNVQTFPKFQLFQSASNGFLVPVNGWPSGYSPGGGEILPNGNPWAPDTSHQPILNYLPYLATGSHYQLELLQAQAAFDIESITNATGTDPTGTVPLGMADPRSGLETRGMAWSLRNIADAAYITPSSDPTDLALKQYFTQALDTSLNGFVQEYVVDNINGNYGQITGFIQGSSGPNTGQIIPEEEDYVALALADIAAMDIPQASADAVALLQWMDNYIAGLYTNGANGLNPLDATSYWTNINNPVTGAPYTTWAQLYQNNASPTWQPNANGYPVFNPTQLINGSTLAYGSYGVVGEAAVANEITYAQSPQVLRESLQAFGFLASQIANAYGGQAKEASSYQAFPQYSIVPRLPDGQSLENTQMLIDTSGNNVTLYASSIPGLRSGQDALLAVVGSGTDTLIGNSVSGGMDLLFGGSGPTELVAGQGNDFLYGGSGNTTFVAGTGNDYLQGGAPLSAYVGAPNTTSNSYEIVTSITSGGRVTTIADFNPQNDLLQIAGRIDGNSITSAAELFASGFVQYDSTSTGSGTTSSAVILLNPASAGATSASDEIILLGVSSGGLNTSNVEVAVDPTGVSAGSSVVVSGIDNITSAVLSGGTLEVIAGGQTTNVTVSGGGSEIDSGGTVSGTIVLNGGSQTVLAGQAVGTIVSAGGSEIVSGGTANGTTVLGGNQTVAGGTASNTTVSGGSQIVATGGTAISATILTGGSQTVTGGTANSTTVAGGSQIVSAGTASGTIVLSGTETVVGGTASNTTVSGGSQIVATGGMAIGATISTGASQFVSGGAAISTTLASGGSEIISAGGTATGTIFAGGDATVLTGGTLFVLAGQQASGVTLSGGREVVSSGGLATSATILAAGSQTVLAGQAAGTIVSAGGFQIVSGGTANGTTVSGGSQIVSGGTANGTTVSGGSQIVSGGTASGTTVLGGNQTVAGGSASNTTVSGGSQIVATGGTAISAIILTGGSQTVTGGMANSTTVAGGSQIVSAGTASGTTVLSGTETVVGGTASNTTVTGGNQTIASGGTAISATISTGASQFVSGGAAISTTLASGGSEIISAGGTATGTIFAGGNATVLTGGTLFVLAGQQASGVTLSGGREVVSSGGLASGTLLLSGGQLLVSGGTAIGTIYGSNTSASVLAGSSVLSPVLSGGVLVVSSGGTVSSPSISNDGTLTLDDGSTVAGDITFTGISGTLTISGTSGSVLSNGTVISGFAPGDVIDLASIPLSSLTSSGLVSGSVLEITLSGGTTYELDFSRPPAGGETFELYGNLLVGLEGILPSSGLTVSAGTSATISSSMLQFSDPADQNANAAAAQTYTVTSLPTDGTLLLSGTPIVSGGTFTQAAVNNGALTYSETASVASSTTDEFSFKVVDSNTGHTTSGTFNIAVTVPPAADAVTATSQTVGYQQSVAPGSIFSVSGPTPTQYQLWLDGPADGSVTDGGGAIATNQAVTETSLGGVNYIGGIAPGQDSLWLRAYDGKWGSWALATLTDPGLTPDTVTATGQSVADQQSVALSGIFAITGPTPSQYQVWLDGPADGAVTDGGGAIATNTAVTETSLSGVNFVGGLAAGQDQLWLRAFDGRWSNWVLATPTDLGAVIDASQSLGYQQSMPLSSLFSVSGPAPTSYDVWLDLGPSADGTVTANGTPIAPDTDVNETSLSGTNFVGGAMAGQDQLWVRADYNNGPPSSWALTTLTDLGAVEYQQSVALGSLFSFEGTPTSYDVWLDLGPSSDGTVTANGTPIAINTKVNETSLSGVDFVGGLTAGQDQVWVRADYNNAPSSSWMLATLTDLGTVTATNQTVGYQQSVPLSSLFAASGSLSYQVWLDLGPSSDGTVTDSGGAILPDQAVNETSLTGVNYIGGATAGQDQLWLRASPDDGTHWSGWALATLTDPGVTPPTVTPTRAAQTVTSGTTMLASNLFGVSNNSAAVTQYGFWDVGTGGGHFTVNGAPQGVNQEIDVNEAQLSQVDFVAGTGTDTLWVRANDGQWGHWSSAFTITG